MKRSGFGPRKTPLRKKSKAKIPTLKANLDALCSEYVRKRADYTCVICGTRNPVWQRGDSTSAECGHLISRTCSALRFDIRPDGNLQCQCHLCNVKHGGQHFRFKVTSDQWPFIEWYCRKFGEARWLELREESKVGRQWKEWELLELIAVVKQKIQELNVV